MVNYTNTRSPKISLIEEHYDIKNDIFVPIWHKAALTLEEAAKYSGIGINKLRDISNEPNCNFVFLTEARD